MYVSHAVCRKLYISLTDTAHRSGKIGDIWHNFAFAVIGNLLLTVEEDAKAQAHANLANAYQSFAFPSVPYSGAGQQIAKYFQMNAQGCTEGVVYSLNYILF
jgi:hypothetical protein